MPSANPIRMAVIGLGFMGSTHWKAARNTRSVAVTAAYSSDPKKLAGDLSAIQGNIGGPGEIMDVTGVTAYSDLDALLADPAIDAVDLCMPTDLHESVAVAALRAGKHVLVEKPMALDGASADRMIAEASRAGRVLMTAQVLRFWPDYTGLRDAVRSGQHGPLRFAVFRRRCAAPGWSGWLGNPARSGGGVFDLLIHDVDMALHLFGKPESLSATGYEDLAAGIDTIASLWRYPDNASVLITGGWHHPGEYPFQAEFTVSLQTATLDFNTAGRRLTLYGGAALPAYSVIDGYTAEIEYFGECCQARKSPEMCPPEESAAAVKLMQLMLESRRQNGETIPCSKLA